MFHKADTIEELAEKAGIDAVGLRASVEHIRASRASGEDTEFDASAFLRAGLVMDRTTRSARCSRTSPWPTAASRSTQSCGSPHRRARRSPGCTRRARPARAGCSCSTTACTSVGDGLRADRRPSRRTRRGALRSRRRRCERLRARDAGRRAQRHSMTCEVCRAPPARDGSRHTVAQLSDQPRGFLFQLAFAGANGLRTWIAHVECGWIRSSAVS